MRWSRRIAVLGLLALAACGIGNLFSGDGAACRTDGNCPSGQTCCDGTCRELCTGGDGDQQMRGVSSLVIVQLVSDYTAGYAFDEILVQLDQRTPEIMPVNAAMHFDKPRRVASLLAVPSGRHDISVTLRLQGADVALAVTPANVSADITVLTKLVRSGSPCQNDAGCFTTTPTCATARCSDGACLELPLDDGCTVAERCLFGVGCVSTAGECQANADCNDLIDCTRDLCTDGYCTNLPDDAACDHATCAPFDKAASNSTGCLPPACSADTCVGTPCISASCIDGACVRAPLCRLSEQCCDGVCGVTCDDPRPCAGRGAAAICRASVGACDAPEVCDGVSDLCPADGTYAAATVCRASAGPCDLVEVCDGTSKLCPPDVVLDASIACRGATLGCDAPESCNGTSGLCPVDVPQPLGTTCRAQAAACDAIELCDGLAKACPTDELTVGNVCRPSVGPCDVAEVCAGAATCPADAVATTSVVCRAATDRCDQPETCDGARVTCPDDVLRPTTYACRAAVGGCDAVENCNGTSAVCPTDMVKAMGAVCRALDGSGCDVVETCDGATTACPGDARAPDNTVCNIDPYTGNPYYCCSGSCACGG